MNKYSQNIKFFKFLENLKKSNLKYFLISLLAFLRKLLSKNPLECSDFK